MKAFFKTIILLSISILIFQNCTNVSKKERVLKPIKSVKDVLSNLSVLPIFFDIDPKIENVIKGEQGTVICIPSNAFQFSNGKKPKGNVKISLKECYKLSDMIANQLSTTSTNEILQTAGMIKIKATSNGKELQIANGKSYVIAFPKSDQKDTMDLFYDVKLPNGSSTWVPDYKMFEFDQSQQNMTEASNESYQQTIEYPITMTDDLYRNNFGVVYESGLTMDAKLQGLNKTISDYIYDTNNVSNHLAGLFVKNKWRVHFDYNIGKDGKMHNLKLEGDPSEYLLSNNQVLNNPIAVEYFKTFLKKIPAFDLTTFEEKFDFDSYDFAIGIMGFREVNWSKFKTKFRNQYSKYQTKAIQKMDVEALDYYIFSSTKLGWINCDKFWDTQDEKIDYVVTTEFPKNTKVQLVFSDINSIMKGKLIDGRFVFENVPVNRKIKIIGISSKDGQPLMSIVKTKIDKKEFNLVDFNEFTLDQLDSELN
jgi:hypothetical protein